MRALRLDRWEKSLPLISLLLSKQIELDSWKYCLSFVVRICNQNRIPTYDLIHSSHYQIMILKREDGYQWAHQLPFDQIYAAKRIFGSVQILSGLGDSSPK
jgi:hypothetical protein